MPASHRSLARISRVEDGSIAWSLGIRPGDTLVSIDGMPVVDILDYRFKSSTRHLTLEISREDGVVRAYKIAKDYDQPLGLEFDRPLFDGIRRCRNRCIFCFVDQLPAGLRESLYVKDDDYRLSFLHGTYLSLTNLTEKDIRRIGEQRLSPLYVSIHATDPGIRVKMMGNSEAGEALAVLRALAEAGVELHSQIVLCPGLNDGRILDKTVRDLAELWPAVRSVAVVPVGRTKHAPPYAPRRPGEREAREVIRQVLAWHARFRERLGKGFVYPSDEFFILGGLPIPGNRFYDDFPQIDNGVGLVTRFRTDFRAEWKRLVGRKGRGARRNRSRSGESHRKVLVSGTAFGKELRRTLAGVFRDFPRDAAVVKQRLVVAEAENRLFGSEVTVAGLLAGADILVALRRSGLVPLTREDELVVPAECLREADGSFLDGIGADELSRKTGATVRVAGRDGRSSGRALARILLS